MNIERVNQIKEQAHIERDNQRRAKRLLHEEFGDLDTLPRGHTRRVISSSDDDIIVQHRRRRRHHHRVHQHHQTHANHHKRRKAKRDQQHIAELLSQFAHITTPLIRDEHLFSQNCILSNRFTPNLILARRHEK